MTNDELRQVADTFGGHLPEKKLFFTMGEVANMLNEDVPTIRYWEKEFDQIRPRRNARGDRLFTAKDVKNMKIVHYLVRECGMTIKGAQRRLKEVGQRPTAQRTGTDNLDTCAEAVERLQYIRKKLMEIYDNL